LHERSSTTQNPVRSTEDREPAVRYAPAAGSEVVRTAVLSVFGYATAVLVAFAAFKFFKAYGIERIISAPAGSLPAVALLLAVGIPLRTRDLTRPERIVYFTTVFVVGLAILAGPVSLPTAVFDRLWSDDPLSYVLLYYGRLFTLAALVLCVFRPVFGVLPFLIYFGQKRAFGEITGISLSLTDWVVVADLGILLLIYVLCVRWAGRLLKSPVGAPVARRLGHEADHGIRDFGVLAVLALHFGNYFYAGLAKTGLDRGQVIAGVDPWTWLLENPTHALIQVAQYSGTLPLAHWPDLARIAYEWSADLVLLLNLFVIGFQLISVVAIVSKRASRTLSVLFDVQHVGIFVLTGIFFWKWIFLNAAFVAALRHVRMPHIPIGARLVLPLFVLLSPSIVTVVKLGWLDTPAVNRIYFLAVDDEGTEHEVPSNYFLTASISFAQQRVARPTSGIYPTRTWGATFDLDVAEKAWSCSVPIVTPAKPLDPDRAEAVARFLRMHHDYILENLDEEGRIRYDLFPHHIWSNPFLFRSFDELDKRRIRSYVLVIESACVLPLAEGRPPVVERRSRYEIAIRPDA